MAYCKNCGIQLVDGAKFCQKCGCPVSDGNTGSTQRKQEFVGKLPKCPRCGEILRSFELNCPACGYELRGAKASNAVREFALKLEAIESRREYEKPHGFFSRGEAMQNVSKTDEQKISLIKSFSVPNTKEDMLEFMILATSSINMRAFDSFSNTDMSKSEKEVNAAWFSKVQQVYEKAKRIYSADNVFTEIQALYDNCNLKIKKTKKKGIIKYFFVLGWLPVALAIVCVAIAINNPKKEAKELERLNNIVLDVQQALGDGEYSHALRIADSIDYQRDDMEMERKWDIEREYWVEKVLEEAAANGKNLEYTPAPDIDNANDEPSDSEDNTGGIVEGFKEGLNGTQENIDEFIRIMNGEESGNSEKKE